MKRRGTADAVMTAPAATLALVPPTTSVVTPAHVAQRVPNADAQLTVHVVTPVPALKRRSAVKRANALVSRMPSADVQRTAPVETLAPVPQTTNAVTHANALPLNNLNVVAQPTVAVAMLAGVAHLTSALWDVHVPCAKGDAG